MITVQDVLSGRDERKESWPTNYTRNSLVNTYEELRYILGNRSLSLNYNKSRFEGKKFESSKNMVIKYKSKGIIKALNNKNYIYLTPTKIYIPGLTLSARRSNEYVAILKWAGLIGYSILILGFRSRTYGFFDPQYEEYGNHCGLMEVLPDGTSILFERTVPWDKVKACQSNATSIRNLFFTEDEIRLIGFNIDQIMNNPESELGMVCKTYIGEDSFSNQEDIPF